MGCPTPRSDTLPPRDGDDTLYTRLRGTRDVKISKAAVIERAPVTLDALRRDGADALLFACTGAFPPMRGDAGVVFPSRILAGLAAALLPTGRLGLLVPAPEQIGKLSKKWQRPGIEIAAEALLPSAPAEEAEAAAARLAAHRPDLIAMDCMSYTPETRAALAPRRRRADAARRLGDRPRAPGALGMTAARELSLDDIEALAVGAWILGTGGGGSPYLGLLNMRRLYAEGHRVALMPPDALDDDDWVAAVSNMGAPLVGQERLTDSRTIARAVALMEEHRGVAFRAVMALEIGGGNSIQPLMAAAHLDKPVVDADMMGRAYPEAQMTSVAVGDLRPYPLTTVDCRGLESIVDKVPSWKWMERVSRKICVEYGSIASTCKAPRTGREVKDWAIHGTTTKAIAIGHAVREAQARHSDPIAAILSVEPGKVLFRGKVVDVDRRTTEGFLRGTARGRRHRRRSRLERRARLPERMDRRLARRRADRDLARPDLRARQRRRRGGRHRNDPLRPARHRHRAAAAAGVRDAEGAAACRPARLRLRHRLPAGVRDETHRHRRRRHQHGCGADRGGAGCAPPSRRRRRPT